MVVKGEIHATAALSPRKESSLSLTQQEDWAPGSVYLHTLVTVHIYHIISFIRFSIKWAVTPESTCLDYTPNREVGEVAAVTRRSVF
jgi:hypothetical protein